MSDQVQLSANSIKELENTLTLIPCTGLCCMFSALYLKWPQCIGFTLDQECLCIKGTCFGLKVVDDAERHDCCDILNARFIMKYPETLCKYTTQCFCCTSRGALPCDNSVPCLINAYGINCCFKNKCACGCCKTIEELTNTDEACKLEGQDQVIAARAQAAESGTAQ